MFRSIGSFPIKLYMCKHLQHVQCRAGKKRPVMADSPDSEGDSIVFDLSAAAAVVLIVLRAW
jgi:hypothetical protein